MKWPEFRLKVQYARGGKLQHIVEGRQILHICMKNIEG